MLRDVCAPVAAPTPAVRGVGRAGSIEFPQILRVDDRQVRRAPGDRRGAPGAHRSPRRRVPLKDRGCSVSGGTHDRARQAGRQVRESHDETRDAPHSKESVIERDPARLSRIHTFPQHLSEKGNGTCKNCRAAYSPAGAARGQKCRHTTKSFVEKNLEVHQTQAYILLNRMPRWPRADSQFSPGCSASCCLREASHAQPTLPRLRLRGIRTLRQTLPGTRFRMER